MEIMIFNNLTHMVSYQTKEITKCKMDNSVKQGIYTETK